MVPHLAFRGLDEHVEKYHMKHIRISPLATNIYVFT
jgi:hypothetical protein